MAEDIGFGAVSELANFAGLELIHRQELGHVGVRANVEVLTTAFGPDHRTIAEAIDEYGLGRARIEQTGRNLTVSVPRGDASFDEVAFSLVGSVIEARPERTDLAAALLAVKSGEPDLLFALKAEQATEADLDQARTEMLEMFAAPHPSPEFEHVKGAYLAQIGFQAAGLKSEIELTRLLFVEQYRRQSSHNARQEAPDVKKIKERITQVVDEAEANGVEPGPKAQASIAIQLAQHAIARERKALFNK